MMKRENTRQRIVEEGARLIREKGFNNTGIQEILQSAAVPRGSFYFYFKSKEEFGLHLVDYYFSFFLLMTASCLSAPDKSPLQRLQSFFQRFRLICEQEQCRSGCPIGSLAQEVGGLNEAFRVKLREVFNKMKTGIKDCLVLALQAHEIDPRLDLDDTADFILNSWEGALLRMKAEGNTSPLLLFEKVVFERVLGS